MSQLQWDRHFLEIARMHTQRSKDPSTKVGAVLVDDRKMVVGMGYNGFPRGVNDDPGRYADRDTKLKFMVHAEVNAVIYAGTRARNSILYTTLPMCNECCKVVIQAGVKEIVCEEFSGSRPQSFYDVSKTMCD